MPIALSTQPESISQLILRSMTLYVTGLPRVLFFSLLLSFIVFTPRLYTLMSGIDIHSMMQGVQIVGMIILEIIALFIFTSMLWRIRCILYNEHESFFSDMNIAIKKLPSIIAAAFIQVGFFAIVTSIVLVFSAYLAQYQILVPEGAQFRSVFLAAILLALNFWLIIYIYYLFIFYLPLILTEDKGIISSLKLSFFLVWGRWFRTFIILSVPWFFYVVLLVIIRKIFNLDLHIYFIEPVSQSTWVPVMVHILIFALFAPWVASALLVQLRDLELRKK